MNLPTSNSGRRSDSGRLRIRFKTAKRRIVFKVSHLRLPVGLPEATGIQEKDRDLEERAQKPGKKNKKRR